MNTLNNFGEGVIRYFNPDLTGACIPMPAVALPQEVISNIDFEIR
jgi:hypothetical protein